MTVWDYVVSAAGGVLAAGLVLSVANMVTRWWRTRRQGVRLPCPYCGYMLRGPAPGGDFQPGPGDVAICWECRKPAIFDRIDGRPVFRLPTPVERWAVEQSSVIKAAMGVAAECYTPAEAVELLRHQGFDATYRKTG